MLLRRFGQRFTRAVSLVHNNGISQLKNALFNSLQFIATTRQHQQEKKIHHSRDLVFRLPHTHCFNQNNVEARCLTEHE